MKVLYQKKFLKDLAAIPSTQRLKIENFVFETPFKLKSFEELKAEKMTGYKNYYKIRFGDYRVGFHFENETITFERVLHRKEIYR